MKIKTVYFSHFAICGVLLFAVLFSPNRLLANDFSGWHHSASGHKRAIRKAEYEEKPLIIYFHVEWCKWCKKMNSDYLASYEVERFLRNIPKVEMNPENGADEEALADKYGVTGYPSFFVSVPSLGSKNERIYPFRKEEADLTNDEFIEAIRQKISHIYNKKGHSCYQKKEYEEAIKYYEKAITFNPEGAYAYFGKGAVHHTVAYRDRDTILLQKAEMDYLDALERDPDHADSKRELARLRKAMEELGIR